MSEQNNPNAGLANLLEDFVNDYQVKPQAPKAAPKGQPEKTVASVMARKEKPGLHPLLEKMSAECEKRLASDIFISVNFPPSFKINGELTPVPLKPLTPQDTEVLVYSTMSDEQRIRFEEELELNYSVTSAKPCQRVLAHDTHLHDSARLWRK